MVKVLIVDRINEKGVEILEKECIQIVYTDKKDEATLKEVAKDVWGIIVRTSQISKVVLENASALKIIGRHGAGVDNIDVEYATKRHVPIINTPDAYTLPVAEYVIGSVLALAKGFIVCDNEVKKGKWAFRESYRPIEIAGTKLGVIGYGRIGKEVSNKALSLGMEVLVYDPYVKELPGAYTGCNKPKLCTQIDEVITEADFLTLHIPYSKESIGLINYEKIKMMKRTSFIINTSRGGIVVEEDLCQALREEIIAGAAVDVFGVEPPQEDHPFFKLNNIILTPHNAALTQNAMIRAATTVAQELVSFYRGGIPLNVVNPAVISNINQKG